jgi:putative SOS response-associated peptidase YedK
MCGRFTQRYTWSEVLQFLRVFGPARNLQPHYTIAPTMTVDVIRLDKSGSRELVPMRWGLIPAWCKRPLGRTWGSGASTAEFVFLS